MGVPFFGPLMKKILGSRNERMRKRLERVVDKVDGFEPAVRKLTDPELQAKTDEFRRRIKDGEKTLPMIPEVLAVAREAMDRAVGIRNIFNPHEKFDPAALPAEARQLYAETKAIMDATPARPPEGALRGCREPIAAWQFVDIPLAIYAAVRELLPDSRPPFRARPFYVQITGAIVLSEGRISEMKTGEGKTIVGPLACYLAACEGNQVHVVTVNDYLVQRDRDWTFPFFRALGLTVGAIHPMHMQSSEDKKIAYSCDVLYGTTSEFGFDYLRDNMKVRPEEQLQKHRGFAIVDEVDSTLIDEARTPLIISGPAHAFSPRYELADRLARHLVARQATWNAADEKVQSCKAEIAGLEGDMRNARDRATVPAMKTRMDAAKKRLPELESTRDKNTQFYEIELDKKRTTMTHDGIAEAQKVAGVGSFYVGDNIDLPHLLEQSLRSHTVYQRDRDYVVAPDEQGVESIVIVDQNTGRKMVGRQWSDGLHQAVEAKEAVRIKEETQTMATITIQNYFKLYKRLAGMTGTADTEATEFHEIYRLDVVSIPTNVSPIRQDRNDLVFLQVKDKWDAIVEEVKSFHDIGRPVLVGTTSVEKSEMLAQLLGKKHQIRHEVLNAKQHEREADIILGAGALGAVMIATNMAGRGTDIKLQKFTRDELVEHWKRRNICPREAKPEWSDEQIIASAYRHMAIREIGKPQVEGLDDAAVYLALLRHWVVERGVAEKKAAGMSAAACVAELDAIGGPPIHRLKMFKNIEEMGGLHIVGTERHESRRIDNQLRGRAGRQGDDGSSRFFLSLEDDLMKMFAGKTTLNVLSRLGMKEGDALDSPMLTRAVEKAQRKVEERNFQMRKQILEYDEPMEFQRRAFYGLRQPIVEGRKVRGTVVGYLESAARQAGNHYLAKAYVGNCISEWVREKAGVHVDGSRFLSKERAEMHTFIVKECLEESSATIRATANEYLSDEVDRSEWDVEGFANWAKQHFDATLDEKSVRESEPLDVVRKIEAAAEKKFKAIDFSPLDQYLERGYGRKELAAWATRTFGVPFDPTMFADTARSSGGVDPVAASTEKLVKSALDAYREREINYPIDFAIEVTSGLMAQNPQAALTQFCAWVKSRYELNWTPESLPSSDPRELRRLIAEQAVTWDQTKIKNRASKCAAAVAREPADQHGEAADRWFQNECMIRLTDDEKQEAAKDIATFASARIAEHLRSEVTQFERWVLLQILDTAWKDHLHSMDQVRDSIGFRAFSQKDPRIEFKKEAARLFEEMQEVVRDRVTDIALKGRLTPQVPRMQQQPEIGAVEAPTALSAGAQQSAQVAPAAQRPVPSPAMPAIAAAAQMVRGSAQQERDLEIAARAGSPEGSTPAGAPTRSGPPVVGRNEPCPCGSGKKYKQCHGRKEPANA
ncbi:MAG: preprotein translocase subunit SecA [Phycisphaerae bacterium]|nr:preprotein translocase subunit SecA [Phycisphaerae bacterium]